MPEGSLGLGRGNPGWVHSGSVQVKNVRRRGGTTVVVEEDSSAIEKDKG